MLAFGTAAATNAAALLLRQRCVELLRKQKLGVATFLILEKQQHLAAHMSKAASPPEGEGKTLKYDPYPDPDPSLPEGESQACS